MPFVYVKHSGGLSSEEFATEREAVDAASKETEQDGEQRDVYAVRSVLVCSVAATGVTRAIPTEILGG